MEKNANATWGRPSWQIFFRPTTLTSDIFAAPWPKSIFNTTFERSIHICLELEVQGHGRTYDVLTHGSKQPHFNRACVVSVKTQSHTTVTTTLLIILQLIFLHSWPADLTLVKLLEVKMHHPQSSGKFLYKSIILDGHITVVLQFWMKSPYCLLLIASSIQASLEFCG